MMRTKNYKKIEEQEKHKCDRCLGKLTGKYCHICDLPPGTNSS